MQSYNWFGLFPGTSADNTTSKPQKEQKETELKDLKVSNKGSNPNKDILFKNAVVVTKEEAKPSPPPIKNKPLSRIYISAGAKQNLPKSYHKVEKVRKIKKEKMAGQDVMSSGDYFLKRKRDDSYTMFTQDAPPLLYELEAAYSDFYGLICPDRVTPTWAVYDEDGKPVGVLSKAIPGFKSLKDMPLKEEDLNKHAEALAEITTVSYIFEEDDLHKNQMSALMRMDFDMSVWSITQHVKGQRILNRSFYGPAIPSFEVSEKDIRSLPELIIAKPFYWPTTERILSTGVALVADSNAFNSEESALFRKLKTNAKFICAKFKVLLKYILTDENMYRNLAKLHIREASTIQGESAIERIAKHEGERIKSFTQALVKMPEFKDFLRRDGEKAMSEIIEAFKKRNDKLSKKSYYEAVKIDLDKIVQTFESIRQEALKNDELPIAAGWKDDPQIVLADSPSKGLAMSGSR